MDLPTHPVIQDPIDELLRLYSTQSGKLSGDDHGAKMPATTFRRGMAGVKMGFIDDFDVTGFEAIA